MLDPNSNAWANHSKEMTMSERNALSRRQLLHGGVKIGLAIFGANMVAACGKKTLKCNDTIGLAPDDVKTREQTYAYQDASPDPRKTCSGCQQFQAPPQANSCGTCKLLKGPVNPNGYCKSWAAKS
jgi:hypothetical protein